MTDRVSDAAILAATATVLRSEDIAAITRVQLIGLAEYAAARGDDPTAARRRELVDALETLTANELVAPLWPGEPYAVAAAALGAALGRDDSEARAVQAALRPLLVRHLDDEMATTTPLIDAFRGKLRNA